MVANEIYANFYKNKRVLITGHTGFKGSWLSILLNQLGAEVYGYALEPPTNPSLYETANIDEIVHSNIGDIRDYENLNRIVNEINPEIIFHMAAQPLVRESYVNPVETYEINVLGTVNLLNISRNLNNLKSIVNITTDKCYENKEWYWGYREDEALGGHDPYSNSKGCSELVTSSFRNSFFNSSNYHDHGIAISSARAGNVIGGGDWANDRLIPDFIRSIINKDIIKIRSPHAIRPWQHVLEPLSGYLLLAMKLYQSGPEFAEAWNFGPEDNDAKNVEWIISSICELWGNNAKYEIEKNSNFHEANYLKLDCSKAKAKLKWYPRWNIDKALSSIVNWTKSYLNNEDMRAICINQINEYFNITD